MFTRTSSLVGVLACFLALTGVVHAVSPAPEKLPGVWREMEGGEGHSRIQDMREASGGKLLSNFNPGSNVTLTFDVPEAMTNARLYVRYNNAMKTTGHLAASLSLKDGKAQPMGELVMIHSPQWNQFRWASLPLGRLPQGTHRVTFSCAKDKVSGGLDVAVVLEDHWGGIYEPPTQFKDGKPVGVGKLVSPVGASFQATAAQGEYERNTPVNFKVQLHNQSVTPQNDELRWVLKDHAGKSFGDGSKPIKLKPGERAEVEITLTEGMKDYGWYIVKFSVGKVALGEAFFVCLPKATRPVPDAAMIRTMLIDGPEHWVGMNLGYGTPDDVIPDFRAAGLRTIRTGGNKTDPAEHESHIQQMVDAGLRIHWVFNYRGNGIDPKGTGRDELANLDLNGPVMKQWFDNYKARCIKFMRHYSEPGKERLRFYIVGNEPNKRDPHTGLPGRPDIAVRLTRAMAEAANEVNPKGIFVQSPSMSQPDDEYLREMIVELGVADHCDIIGTHMYGSQTLSWRSGKPWVWLKEAGARRLVACTESGVSTGWTPKGYDGREWQADFMAMSQVMERRFGYAAGILFTHDDDHTADWALMRAKGEVLQPNWDFIKNVLTRQRQLVNGGFEQANDPRSMWTPHVNIDIPGWLSDRFDWQDTKAPHSGKSSVRFIPNTPENRILSRREKGEAVPELVPEPLIAYQVATVGITPGKPVTVTAFARTTGTPGTTATLSVQGYDPLDGMARAEKSTTSAEWTQLSVTVTPVNPWIVIGLEAPPADHAGDCVWFDDISVGTAE